ncbi:unnamed protein product [Litomosoides sigmodontis]|uniref:Uncharacterized protein n=1 Tax=Litomosoides sigmodontis TaxID=42156 RepID=A0A3P6TE06_LITSI|nr:unnamed protein product [Litomosoides sigmodontis]
MIQSCCRMPIPRGFLLSSGTYCLKSGIILPVEVAQNQLSVKGHVECITHTISYTIKQLSVFVLHHPP